MERLLISSLFTLFLCSPAAANDEAKASAGRGLFFETEGRSLELSAPQVVYDLKKSKGQFVDFGNGLVFSEDSLTAQIENNKLEIKWNAALISSGELTIINELGKEIWKRQIFSVGSWSFDKLNSPESPQWNDGEKFRFCLRSEKNKGHVNLCTPNYAVVSQDAKTVLGRSRSDAEPRIILQNEESPLKGAYTATAGMPVQFLATLKSGASYDFVSAPIHPILKDLVQKGDQLSLTGELPAPLHHDVKIIPGEQYGSTARYFGFEKTVGAQPDLWEIQIVRKNAQLTLPGTSGGLFSYKIEVKDVPLATDRLYLSESLPLGTYLAKDRFILKNSQGEAFAWEFEAPQKNSLNKIAYQNSYLDIYRGSPREASLRFTGVSASNSNLIVLGEAHFAWWFNDLFGWQNEFFSRQRWGISLNYMSSLMDFTASDNHNSTEKLGLSALQADLRYRLTPGLSGRDATWGLIMAYESVTLASDSVPKLGIGTFWSRSMPNSVDKWISKLPFMDAPKWVNFEVLTFPVSTDSDINLKEEFSLNFHGKVMWSPSVYGEAGFGLRSYHYEFESTGYGAKISTIYGNIGLGIHF